MGTAQAALDVARHWIDYHETGGDDGQSGNVTVFGEWYGMNGVPWCAIFVSYCTYTSGTPCPATTPKGFAYCPSGIDWFQARGRWFTSDPKPGDLIFYDWDADGVSDHVGIVEATGPDGIHTIEGNEENQVERRVRTASIMGFGRPAYSSAATPATAPSKKQPRAPSHTRWPGRYLTLTSPYTDGDDVHTVQSRLEHYRIGYGAQLQGTGAFGPKTFQAVKDFQRTRHLEVDGVVGPITWDALFTS